jgi:hypothetical protein
MSGEVKLTKAQRVMLSELAWRHKGGSIERQWTAKDHATVRALERQGLARFHATSAKLAITPSGLAVLQGGDK